MTEFVQYTPKGYQVTTYGHKATAEELLAEEEFLDSLSESDFDYDEDPDSDGYGWERAALQRIS